MILASHNIKLREFAQKMLKSYGISQVQVPDWPNSDYETIYVFHITRTGQNGIPRPRLKSSGKT